ncbi:putative component of NuA3 histone acetyltransferase complex [Neophaeococcomyces mojaviensis]|uniref:Component of NuA3 histone acetyltransferase complex n=1 Tax=Neophaeococcomyces mojaviensis TaxID=3383035 RepID=A0ACC3A589_9EURO|nr:putative component of NuA3 histone acetyltransferase complex [Knufia sp. JES_112]
MAKRKADTTLRAPSPSKKRNVDDSKAAFRTGLFEASTVQSFHNSYATSGPYPHAVVSNLIQESLLRDVRSEIINNITFTLKETDIYRIHQSGDLANLSKLPKEQLRKLPSLVKLRDALYSQDFRAWVSQVTGAGKLSGQKTDMAVNVYTPGSYLLCHDDVIGSRRVSYILYLTDPDNPWKAEWGGGLRLYPTEDRKNKAGEDVKVPFAKWSLNIPPSFSQLSFFAVRPGESYHDVEEVYHGKNAEEDKGRIRMAVSGWFHIPQEGEDGYEEGVEQAQAQKSSLAQLQGAADEFDEPQTIFRHFDEPRRVINAQLTATEVDPGDEDDEDDTILTEQDLTFLIQYIAPGFLVPDKLDELSEAFQDTSMLQLDTFLAEKFAKQLKTYIQAAEITPDTSTNSTDSPQSWPIARPPHKHRFAYLREDTKIENIESATPISRLLVDLLHSHAFKKWLALATGLESSSLVRQHALARRFRAGVDYALANTYTGEQPRLEFTINMSPTTGWEHEDKPAKEATNRKGKGKGKSKVKSNGTHQNGSSSKNTAASEVRVSMEDTPEFGGEEVYMAADETPAPSSNKSKDLPSVGREAHDPAVYQSGDNADDGILFANSPSWNTFSVVLRDKDTMRFVKYVSQAARGDRWDIKGEIELSKDAFDGEEGDDEEMAELNEDDVEEEIEFSEGDDDVNDDDDDDEDDA